MSFLNIGKDENKNLTKSKIIKITSVKGDVDITNVTGNVEEETRKVLIKKAPIGKYQELSNIFNKFFNLFEEFLKKQGVKNPEKYIAEMTAEQGISLIPSFLGDIYEFAIEELIEFIAIGSGLKEEFIRENLDAEETYEVVKAIIEINGLLKVGKEVKNLINLPNLLQTMKGRKNIKG